MCNDICEDSLTKSDNRIVTVPSPDFRNTCFLYVQLLAWLINGRKDVLVDVNCANRFLNVISASQNRAMMTWVHTGLGIWPCQSKFETIHCIAWMDRIRVNSSSSLANKDMWSAILAREFVSFAKRETSMTLCQIALFPRWCQGPQLAFSRY